MEKVANANHSGDGEAEILEISLSKNEGGFGFNIVGGTDRAHLPHNSGFFISRIRHGGPAFSDGRIAVGDRLISIDNIDLSGKTHDEAVAIFNSVGQGEECSLLIEKDGEKRFIKQMPIAPVSTPVSTADADSIDELPRTPKRPPALPEPAHYPAWTEVLFVAIGAAALGAAVIVGYRLIKRS